ncbi:pyocin knob domain-containing S74 family peptidase [Chitinophaga vietnamensis]|uniref:pyocin knob domain-containing S74 family peptidase n=1 Tax=Chitinophaga vietnamensis TaxID=2593957 RepID=UPI001178A024|nr:pyocin knob domain-containing S74 family peptidase [Chitinophaga vietnamensis]
MTRPYIMKAFSIFMIFLLAVKFSDAQKVYQIRADSVRIYNVCDTAELILENRTQNTIGFLYNKGKGRTEFRRLKLERIGSNSIAIAGQDTLNIQGLSKVYVDTIYRAGDNIQYRINGNVYTLYAPLSAETLQSVTDRGSNTNRLISVAKDNVLDPNLYARGNFEARGASAPSYGFQIPGVDGVALYYPGAGANLRVRSGGGIDGQLWSSANDNEFLKYRNVIRGNDLDNLGGANGIYPVSYTGYSSGVLNFSTGGSLGTFQLEANYDGLLRWRNKTDSKTWTDWKTIWHTGNFNPADLSANTEGNWGQQKNYGDYNDFNAVNRWGGTFVHGTANGPAVPGAQQYYHMKLSLGSDYSGATGAGNGFAMQLAIPRTPLGGNPYLSVRYLENGAWGSWSKIWSGYSDQTGSIANDNSYMRFHWSGQNGQPAWLWGGNSASDMYVYNPANFSVNNADNLGNISEQGFARAGVKEGGIDWNSLTDRTFIGSIAGSVNGPINNGVWWNIINTRHRNGGGDGNLYGMQIAQGMTADNDHIFFRSQNSGAWYPWREFWHSGNVTFATSGANIALKTDANGYIITDNWFRTGNNTGLYTLDGSYLYKNANGSWALRGVAGATASWLEIQTGDGTNRGGFYGDANGNIGLVNAGANGWRLRTDGSGNLFVTGQVSATAFYQASQRSLKRDIHLFNKSALSILNTARVQTFRYKADSTNITHIGFIADEVPDEMASPERKGVDQANTVALLVKALQEMSEKVDALQNKVQALQQQVDRYERK